MGREIIVLAEKGLPKETVDNFRSLYLNPLRTVLSKYSTPYREENRIMIFLSGPVDVAHREEYYPQHKMVYFNPDKVQDLEDFDYSFQALLHGTFHAEQLGWEEFRQRHKGRSDDIVNILNPSSYPDPQSFLEEGFAEVVSFDELGKAVADGVLPISTDTVMEKTRTRFPSYARAEEVCRQILADKSIGNFAIDATKLHVKLDFAMVYDLIKGLVELSENDYRKLVQEFCHYHPNPRTRGEIIERFEV